MNFVGESQPGRKGETMKVVIIGASHRNHGAQAMLLTVVSCLQNRFPGIECIVVSYAKEDEARSAQAQCVMHNGMELTYDVVVDRKRPVSICLQLLICYLPSVALRNKASELARFPSLVGGADAVIDISGFGLSSMRPWWRNLIYWLEAKTTRRLGKPFVAMTQSFGPFSTKFQRKVARSTFANCALISARGSVSAHHVSELGLKEGKDFTIAPDITYLFPAARPVEAKRLYPFDAVPAIAVTPNTNVFHRTCGQGAENLYVRMIASLCTHASKKSGCHLLFLCHEHYEDRFDDHDLSQLIQCSLGGGVQSTIIGSGHSPYLLKSIIALCDMAIVSRFHGMIAALSSGVPTLTIGWAQKYEESAVMAALEGFTIDLDTVDIGEVIRLFDDLWENRHTHRERILRKIPRNKNEAEGVFDQLATLLKQACAQDGDQISP